MGIIIAKYPGCTLPIERIQEACTAINDRVIMTYRASDTDKLDIHRYDCLDMLLASEEARLLEDPDTELVICMMPAVRVETEWTNISPCLTRHGYLVYYDGYLPIEAEGTSPLLERYARSRLDRLDPDTFHDPEWQWLEGRAIQGARLIIHTPKGIVLLNARDGAWEGMVWYSNAGYKGYPNVPKAVRTQLMVDLDKLIPDYNRSRKDHLLEQLWEYMGHDLRDYPAQALRMARTSMDGDYTRNTGGSVS